MTTLDRTNPAAYAAIPTLAAVLAALRPHQTTTFPLGHGGALAMPAGAEIELCPSLLASVTFEVAARPAGSSAVFKGRTFRPDARGAYLLRVGLVPDDDDTQRAIWWLEAPVAALGPEDFAPLVGFSDPAFALERLRAIQAKVGRRSFAELAADFAARPRPGTLPW